MPEDSPRLGDEPLSVARAARLATLLESFPIGDLRANQDEVLLDYLDRCIEELDAEGGSIMVFTGPRELAVRVVRGDAGRAGLSPVPLGHSVAGRVAETATGLLVHGTPAGLDGVVPKRRAPASAVSVPIRLGGRTLGVLNLNRWTPSRRFTDADLQAARLLAHQVAWMMGLGHRMAELWDTVVTDALTGLHTRRYFRARLDEEIARASRYELPLCVVMTDLDEFKQINTYYGHLAADEVLHDLGALVRRHVRSMDVPARYGGDEFVLLLPEADLDTAVSVIKRLQEAVAAYRFVGPQGEPIVLSLCAGITLYPLDGRDADELLRRADLALLDAKARGPGTLSIEVEEV